MLVATVVRPGAGENAPYYDRYIGLVPGDDALPALIAQIGRTAALLDRATEQQAAFRYAPEKWSVKQVVNHLSDGERVFAYRAMRIARADTTPLPGFDENAYAATAEADRRPLADLVLEYRAVRAATIALFASFGPEALARVGTANDSPISPRALGWIVAGHELHHRSLLIERYGLTER